MRGKKSIAWLGESGAEVASELAITRASGINRRFVTGDSLGWGA
jgi:hypothetical protein